jgi:hypothetical protein
MVDVQLHAILRSCPVNNIIVAVKDRPLCRSVVLHKDRAGRLGIQAESTTESSRAGTI